MIDRFDVVSCMTVFLSGRYVLYEDHLAEIEAHVAALTDSLLAEIHRLDKDLALNASMLARQTDLARDAETIANRQAKEIKRLRNAIEGALRIDNLWVPFYSLPDHKGEVVALHEMRQNFLEALKEQP